MTCIVCGDRDATVGPRCRTCYAYLWRTGRERDDYLRRRDLRRELRKDRAWWVVANHTRVVHNP